MKRNLIFLSLVGTLSLVCLPSAKSDVFIRMPAGSPSTLPDAVGLEVCVNGPDHCVHSGLVRTRGRTLVGLGYTQNQMRALGALMPTSSKGFSWENVKFTVYQKFDAKDGQKGTTSTIPCNLLNDNTMNQFLSENKQNLYGSLTFLLLSQSSVVDVDGKTCTFNLPAQGIK